MHKTIKIEKESSATEQLVDDDDHLTYLYGCTLTT